ncbi:hypothetical protein MUU53_15620 [Rhizobium lemnae]|uniref:DUF6894 family protein n=1 Tax=Rhizobium lemnae TaxID=1214924 RepID=A0ABV8E625_9HYPH|nr:hypothetical protein [Rhizobium lemnae]MCJ8509344.1 hypothetical protein [Rhizobium lemnae]
MLQHSFLKCGTIERSPDLVSGDKGTTMTRFCFRFRDEVGQETEEVELELPSCLAAIKEASRILIDMARDEIRDRTDFHLSLIVREESGLSIVESSLRYSAKRLCEDTSQPSIAEPGGIGNEGSE